MASQSETAMQLTWKNVEESNKDSNFDVSEIVENATQINDTIEAVKDDPNVCKSTELNEQVEKYDSIEAVDHKELMPLTSNTALMRSNDEEADQDLSLEVLEKAENATQIDDIIQVAEVLKDDKIESTQIDNVIEAAEVPKDDKSVSTQIDNVIEAAEVPKDANFVSISSVLKEEIEENDWIKVGDEHVIVDKEIKETVGCDSLENKKSIEDKIEISDNIVMRKLLVL